MKRRKKFNKKLTKQGKIPLPNPINAPPAMPTSRTATNHVAKAVKDILALDSGTKGTFLTSNGAMEPH